MPSASFFAKLGLFVMPDFLGTGLCASIREEIRSAPSGKAMVAKGGMSMVDQNTRRTKWVKVSRETYALVEERLDAMMPAIGSHFKLALTNHERLQFLRYQAGDFFEPHTDNSDRDDAFEEIKSRRVSAVVFLNREAEVPGFDGYAGGALTLYGLVDKPGWEGKGFSLRGETGLLVAFPSDVHHEVKPVTHGERYTIVTWFS